ncbi:hypothetical protein EVAR_102592_1 [Eumeta japonica]|uniref:Uncharacterized protein n=1 Tax=Eumeta variegata TaxID=151549 RepID=A0A4C1TV22_EUMVA|nr:hypothetical protein EVAR_102592_1 [Eumeta japonica]
MWRELLNRGGPKYQHFGMAHKVKESEGDLPHSGRLETVVLIFKTHSTWHSPYFRLVLRDSLQCKWCRMTNGGLRQEKETGQEHVGLCPLQGSEAITTNKSYT